MGPGMGVSPRPGRRWRTWLPARSFLRSPTRPLPRANGLCCWGHPGLEVRRPQSAILVAAGRSGHPSDRRVPRRCGGIASQAGKRCQCFWQHWYSGSALSAVDRRQNMKCSSLVVFCSWRGQASALQTRSARAPRRCFQTDFLRSECWRTKVSRSGQPFRRPWSTSMRWVFIRLQTF